VDYLLGEAGADVNHEDLKQETPMIIAKRTGKKQLINLLLKHGAKTPTAAAPAVEEVLKPLKSKKQLALTTELVKDLPPSLLKKTSDPQPKTEPTPTEKK